MEGEKIDALYEAVRNAVVSKGCQAVVSKRVMCPGIEGVENTTHGHDALEMKVAIPYLNKRNLNDAAKYVESVPKTKDALLHMVNTKERMVLNCRIVIFLDKHL